MRILLVEDELPLSRAILKILEKNNYSADAVYNGFDALDYIDTGNYDAMILDIMIPKLNGIAVLKRLRADGNNIPVLVLSAKSEIEDKVAGLDSGANYYLTKPFDTRELLASIRAITRVTAEGGSCLTYGNITLDRASFEIISPTGRTGLSNKEFQIFELLMMNPKRVLSTEKLMEKVWGYDSESEINVVWVYVSYLRKKLTDLGASIRIKASRNVGYSLEEKQ